MLCTTHKTRPRVVALQEVDDGHAVIGGVEYFSCHNDFGRRGGFDTPAEVRRRLLNHRFALGYFAFVKYLLRQRRKKLRAAIYQSFALSSRPTLNLLLSIIGVSHPIVLLTVNQLNWQAAGSISRAKPFLMLRQAVFKVLS